MGQGDRPAHLQGNLFVKMETNYMKINLSKSVQLKELCKISAIGNTKYKAKRIEFTFNREAILGFATELLWLYDVIEGKQLTISTYQLKVDPAPSQALGFYLTPSSPMLAVKTNSLIEAKNKSIECKVWKDIEIKTRSVNEYFEVREPAEELDDAISVETYELSRRNLVNICLLDEEGRDITEHFISVIFEINTGGIKDLATMLLVWANNCKEGDAYLLSHMCETECGYNMGIVLTEDSIAAILKCDNLGSVSDYDSRI